MSVQSTIAITVNGQQRAIRAGATVAELVRQLELNPQLVAVEVDRELVRKATFEECRLEEGATIEIVEFVGGG
jgi:thiazole synthase